MENDAGEPYSTGLPDFFSAHAFYRNKGTIRAVALGDFHANFGQGLVLFSYPSFGKSSQQGRVMRAEEALQPFTGRNEFSFLRGAGITLGWEDLEWTILATRRNLDARIDTIANAFDLQTDGLHRTETERNRKNQYQWNAIASRVSYTKPGSYKVGASVVANQGSGSIGISPEAYERYRTFPNQWVNAGVDAKVRLNRMALFFELAASSNGGWSSVGGIEAQPASGWVFSMVARNLGLQYRALMMNPFSNTQQAGERGLFFGMQGTLPKGWSLSGFADFYQYTWLRYRTDAPTPGSDFMLQPEFNPSRETRFYVRMRYRDGLENEAGESNGVPKLERIESTSLRAHLSHQVSPRVTVASRAEATFFQRGPEFTQGWMVFQEATYKAGTLSVSGRLALVNIEDYDNRMYAYERDLPYLFSVPAYFGKGIRWYLVANWKINRHAELGLRMARWTRPGETSQGSGNDETSGKHRTDLRAQVVLTL